MNMEVRGQDNRPKDTPYSQQRMKAWRPILTPDNASNIFLRVGLFCILTGVLLLVLLTRIDEVVIDYTDLEGKCYTSSSNTTDSGLQSAKAFLKDHKDNPEAYCSIDVHFTLESDFAPNSAFFYGLENFYQNHRVYIQSRSDDQLSGRNLRDLPDQCQSFSGETPVLPCGAVANSMFTDTFQLFRTGESEIALDRSNLAWDSDRNFRFANPQNETEFEGTVKPAKWKLPVQDLPNKLKNEDLMVWMRVSAFPNFRKLWAHIPGTLKRGDYTVRIKSSFPVDAFNGRKSFAISESSILGGRNLFVGVAYAAMGVFLFGVGAILSLL